MAKRKTNSRKTPDKKTNLLKGNERGQGFTKDNQPSPEAKSAGHKKKRVLADLADSILTGDGLQMAQAIAKIVGFDMLDSECTLELAMTLKQAEKALQDGDTSAYNAAMDRLRGKAKQSVDVTSGGEKIEQWITIAGQKVKI